MPTLRFARRTRGRRTTVSRSSHPRVRIVGETGTALELPLAPSSVDHDGLAGRWVVLDRVGRKPLLGRAGAELRSYSTTLEIVGRRAGKLDATVPVEPELATLRALARHGERVRWERFGPSEGGLFRITELSVTDRRRQEGTNAITHAAVRITLTEASDAVTHVGPVSGGVKPPGGGAAAPSAGPASKTHTVVKGDTLWAIAARYYRDGSRWPRIADANGVTDPRKLRVGQRLTIPA